MTYPWIAAFIALAGCVMVLTAIVICFMRNIGDHLERSGRTPAAIPHAPTPDETAIGSQIPHFGVFDEKGLAVKALELCAAGPVLVLFMTPACASCAALANELRRQDWSCDAATVAIMPATAYGPGTSMGANVRVLRQDERQSATRALRVPGTPYAFLIGRGGILLARGPARTLDELQELTTRLAA
ncbi:MAG: TlpA family protein disulfide reductase [Gaiellaceae bacterium]